MIKYFKLFKNKSKKDKSNDHDSYDMIYVKDVAGDYVNWRDDKKRICRVLKDLLLNKIVDVEFRLHGNKWGASSSNVLVDYVEPSHMFIYINGEAAVDYNDRIVIKKEPKQILSNSLK